MKILTAKNLHKTFGGVSALNGVNFSVERKSITGLIGPNGSGKTTLFNVLTGFITPDKGIIEFNGSDLTRLSVDKIANKGVIRSFQIPKPFSKMTVMENILISAKYQIGENILPIFLRKKDIFEQEHNNYAKGKKILDLLELSHLENEFAASLSGGQRKLLELARILMADPEIILLDEPVAGVNPTLANKIFEKIIELRNEFEKTFLIVEHNIDIVKNYCEYVGVMNRGEIISEGTPKKVFSDEKVMNIYLGIE
jgi:branched-chain amino acid transport system ATP-binding protein